MWPLARALSAAGTIAEFVTSIGSAMVAIYTLLGSVVAFNDLHYSIKTGLLRAALQQTLDGVRGGARPTCADGAVAVRASSVDSGGRKTRPGPFRGKHMHRQRLQ